MGVTLHPAGRVLVIRTGRVIDGFGPAPEQIARYADYTDSDYVLIDTTSSAYADSNGVRWLLRFTNLDLPHRIVTRRNSLTARVLGLFGCGNLFDCPRSAWRTSWSTKATRRSRNRGNDVMENL